MTDLSPARIVIADDDSDIRRLVAFTLRRRGHTIYEASTGSEAESLVRDERPDLAILDVTMPEQSGIDVVCTLASDAAYAHIPIMLLSARGQPAEIEEGLACGAAAYLVKPFSPKELAEKVHSVLARASGSDGS